MMDITEFIKQIDQQRKELDAIYHGVAVKYGLSKRRKYHY